MDFCCFRKSSHVGLIEMDSATEKRFRDPDEVADSDFAAAVEPYLRTCSMA
jgi:hypothetical protein